MSNNMVINAFHISLCPLLSSLFYIFNNKVILYVNNIIISGQVVKTISEKSMKSFGFSDVVVKKYLHFDLMACHLKNW